MAARVLEELRSLDPALLVFLLYLRCLTRKAKWAPRPTRLAKLTGLPLELVERQMYRLRAEGVLTDQWLGRSLLPGPRLYVSLRALRTLADLGLPPVQQLLLFRLVGEEEEGRFIYNPAAVLQVWGVPEDEAKVAATTFRRLGLLRRDGPVAEFLLPPRNTYTGS